MAEVLPAARFSPVVFSRVPCEPLPEHSHLRMHRHPRL
jgi:hypothetical protein